MSVAMLSAPSRTSTSSSSSFVPVSRQNTISSYDGSRSARQSKRYSVTALYLSGLHAKEKELEIDDDLAKGMMSRATKISNHLLILANSYSSENTTRTQGEDIVTVQEELYTGERCQIFGFEDSAFDSESNGARRGKLLFTQSEVLRHNPYL